MTNIILCGGNGTRLWPISRTLMPKQFVKLFDDKSLFQLTVERNSKVCDSQFIVSNTEQYFLALDQLEELHKTHNRYLLEPAIVLACMALEPDEIVLVTPSDHLIKDEVEYEKVLKKAKKVKVVPSNIKWSDVGSFDTLAQELPNDENNNLILSDKIVKTIDIQDSIIVEVKRLSLQTLDCCFRQGYCDY